MPFHHLQTDYPWIVNHSQHSFEQGGARVEWTIDCKDRKNQNINRIRRHFKMATTAKAKRPWTKEDSETKENVLIGSLCVWRWRGTWGPSLRTEYTTRIKHRITPTAYLSETATTMPTFRTIYFARLQFGIQDLNPDFGP